MKSPRLLVLVVLVYVALDLSLPAMPGAFVFESADSTESTQVRARAAAESVALPAPARDPEAGLFQPPPPGDDRPGALAPSEGRAQEAFLRRPSRAQDEPAPPSEDPH